MTNNAVAKTLEASNTRQVIRTNNVMTEKTRQTGNTVQADTVMNVVVEIKTIDPHKDLKQPQLALNANITGKDKAVHQQENK